MKKVIAALILGYALIQGFAALSAGSVAQAAIVKHNAELSNI